VSQAIGPNVLIVDDDHRIRSMLGIYLSERSMHVREAADGRQMFAVLQSTPVDVVLLDIMLPGDDGFTLCRRLRAYSAVPVILLTAMNEATDRVVGLELGADDYISKPFDPRELVARIRAILRRTGSAAPGENSTFHFEGWSLDPRRRTLHSAAGVQIELTSGEFDLLLAFVEHPQRILDRDRLLDLARGRTNQVFDRSIDVQISRLRRKVEIDPQDPVLIKTVRSEGYIFTADVKHGSAEKDS
jgi:two-component system, OmpR family, response regulator